MIERLLVAAIVIVVITAFWVLLRRRQLRKANQALSRPSATMAAPMLLYFSSKSCIPCTTQAQYIDDLKHVYPGYIDIRQIDTDQESETAASYGIFTVPTTLIVDGSGDVRHVNYGLTRTSRLATQLENI